MRKLLLIVTTALMAGGLMAARADAQNLRIGLNEDADVLDPALAQTFVGRIVFTSLCDKLVDVDANLKFVPQLATSWQWGADNKSLTFHLRKGVTFQDGTPFNADAVKYNIERSKTLKGSFRRSELNSVATVDVLDPLTVRLNFSKPDATVLAQLSDRAGMMISPTAAKAEGASFGTHPVCSGPYKFVERVQNDRIVLEKYKGYWNAAQYHFDRVTFLPIPDTTVRLANLQAGDLDLIERLAATDIPAVKANPQLGLTQTVGLGYQGITINIANGPRGKSPIGSSSLVRQAFSLAIDRSALSQVVFNGTNPPAWQAFPPKSPYFDGKMPTPGRDIAKAKALLKQAGFGGKPVPVEMTFGNNNISKQVAETIQAMTAEAGFQVTIQPVEFAAMLSQNVQGNFMTSQFGWSGRVDPDGDIYSFVTCKGALNDGHYCNPKVDDLLNQARLTTDEAQRKALYQQADAILNQDLPIIYLYYQPWIYAHTARLKGFTAYPDGMIRLQGVTLAAK